MRYTFVCRTRDVLIGALLIMILASQAVAVDRDWNKLSGVQVFNNGANWTPSAVPLAADNLTFGLDGDVDIFLGNPSVGNNITFNNGMVEFLDVGGTTLNSGGVVTIDDLSAAGLGDGAQVTLNGANWVNVGDAIVGGAGFGSFTLNSGGDFTSASLYIGDDLGSTGEVTVDGIGSTLTADAVGAAFGIFIGNAGTGTMNVTGGGVARTIDAAGAADWELGVTADGEGTLNIDGAGSTGFAEDVIIGLLGSGNLNITGGGVFNQNVGSSPDAFVAQDVGSTGDVTVSGDGSQWLMARLEIGNLGDATLSIEDGGLVRNNSGDMVLADAGGSGKVAVFGTPDTGAGAKISTLQVTNNLFVGSNGLGELRVGVDLDADLNSNPLGAGHANLEVGTNLRIGSPSSNQLDNIAYISGPNTTVTVGSVLYAGENGRGTLELRDGATLTAAFPRIGSGALSNGTLVVTGTDTTFTATNNFVVATNGTGNATVSDGAVLNNASDFWVGHQANAVGTLTIDDATVNATTSNAGNLQIGGRTDGSGGNGTLTVQNGGTLNVTDEAYIGGNSTASGTLIVTGLGSTYFHKDGSVNDLLRIGYGGAGTAEVRDGGRIDAEGIVIGSLPGSAQAELLVTGSNSGTPSTVDIDGFLYVGDARQGTMTVEQGARVRVATSLSAERLFIGDDNAADGSKLTITGSGSRVDYHGTGDVSVGNAGGSTSNRATLEITAGGVFSAVQRNPDMSIASQARIIVGDVTNGNGHIIVDGADSLVEASVIYVGDGDSASSGILDITNGGAATTTGEFQAGSNGNGVGTVNVDGAGSTLTVGTTLSLGDDVPGNGSATGNLNITDGGMVANGGQAYIGHFTGSFGTATLGSATADVSSWTIGGELIIAGTETSSQLSGFGVLNVNAGGRVDVASNLRIRNLGDVNLSGGEIAVGDQLDFVDAGSTFNFTSGTLRFTKAAGYTLNGAQLDGLLGVDHTLGANQHLAVDGAAVLSTPLRLNGGTFSVGSITVANLANLDFDAGTLNLTNANLTVGAGGIFGATLVVDAPQAIHVTNQATIDAGAQLVVAGEFSSGGLTNQGDLTAIDATIGGPVVNNSNVTVVGTVDFNGLVSGPGDFFGPGTANFNGGMAPGASPAEVAFEGSVALADTNTLFIEIAGTTLGDDYDSLTIVGDAALDGILDVSLVGFSPTIGQQFTILTASSIIDNGLVLGGAAASSFSLLVGSTSVILQAIAAGVPGDYNQDGTVNAADYTVWRNNLGSATSLPNDNTAGVGQDDYARWKMHFGETAGSGSGIGSNAAVPEPASATLLITLFTVLAIRLPGKYR